MLNMKAQLFAALALGLVWAGVLVLLADAVANTAATIPLP